MRGKLQETNGVRSVFVGTFERFGSKSGWKGRSLQTVLLIDIKDVDGNDVCDHLWFNLTQEFDYLGLKPGDVVQFCGRVTAYERGYLGRRSDVYCPNTRDYKLSRPTQIQVIQRCSVDRPQPGTNQANHGGAA